MHTGRLTIPSMKARVSAEEWEARVNLAACYRLVALYDMSSMIANHISVVVPGAEDKFLINAYGLLYEEITASSLITIDSHGEILTQADFEYGISRAGFVIHSAIHRARPDAKCIIHTHTWAGMAVAAMQCGLLPLTQTVMRFAKVGYHDYEGPAEDLGEQARIVRDLGDADALIMRNHGLLVVGATIAEAFFNIHRLELSCKAQVAAMSADVVLPPPDVVALTNRMYQPEVRRPYGILEWPALLRKLDRLDPSFRD
jgi:ribulose-5-phosphate 4-epimerase/fuculose-1-phosphate aldolase